jgi:hypothetical protein
MFPQVIIPAAGKQSGHKDCRQLILCVKKGMRKNFELPYLIISDGP